MKEISQSEIKVIEAQVKSDPSYISLSQGALRVGGVPVEIKNFLREVLKTDKTDYYQSASGILPLREAIASNLEKLHSTSVTYKNVVVTHGCSGAVSLLLLALLKEGDEVILPEPTYPAYRGMVELAGGKCKFVSCVWEMDLDEIEKACTNRTKVILFSNPCNPMGTVCSKSELTGLVELCEKHKIYLIVDESYDDYIFSDGFQSITPFVSQSKYVIRTGSYSKTHSMSGWRLGYMLIPENLFATMDVAQNALLNCPNVIAQYAVLYALDHPEFVQRFHNMVKNGLNMAVDLLEPLVKKGIISFHVPKAGFYLFLKTKEADSNELCMRILNEAKVGLIPGRAFGPSCPEFMRLCFARTPDVLEEGIKRIISFFEQN